MTITYSLDVSSSSFLGIHRLLLRWKGSIWKCIWPELLFWIFCYAAVSATYRVAMTRRQQMLFEDICVFFSDYNDYIPITFMLGFYVSVVFSRWNEIFMNLGWVDSPALLIATVVRGTTEEARMIRRTIMRYMVLVQVLVYRDISAAVKKRFPTMDHLVTAGIMTAEELKEYDAIETQQIKYWPPIQWIFMLLRRAREQGMIDSDIIYVDVLEKVRQYRVSVLTLTLYDWVPIPLVYTQVVNLAVRLYFLIALFARQFLNDYGHRGLADKAPTDLYVPIMTILQFLFYMGWMKVAEMLLNPLGEDDDDFETNWIIDRNLEVGLLIVDDCYARVPRLAKDQFWEQSSRQPLYTREAANRPQNPMMGSCNDLQQQEDMLVQPPRRRRLMSSVAGLEGTYSIGSEDDADYVVPVHNHNPSRRISIVQPESGGMRKASKLLENVRRKLSKAQLRRKDSNESSVDAESGTGNRFERGNSTRVSNNSVASTGSSVQSFLWGGAKTAKVVPKSNGDLLKGQPETEQKTEQAPEKEMLPVIEEESEPKEHKKETQQRNHSNAMSSKSTSLESVSSGGNSRGGGGGAEGGRKEG